MDKGTLDTTTVACSGCNQRWPWKPDGLGDLMARSVFESVSFGTCPPWHMTKTLWWELNSGLYGLTSVEGIPPRVDGVHTIGGVARCPIDQTECPERWYKRNDPLSI